MVEDGSSGSGVNAGAIAGGTLAGGWRAGMRCAGWPLWPGFMHAAAVLQETSSAGGAFHLPAEMCGPSAAWYLTGTPFPPFSLPQHAQASRWWWQERSSGTGGGAG